VSLRIRLSRVGAKKQPSYRIVVADSMAPRDGKAIAILGHYNPLTNPYTLKVDEERAVRWLQNGALPSDTARGLLAKAGVMTAYESARKSTPKKAKASAAEETKARRAARVTRTEPPRLVRPGKREGTEPAAAAAPKRAAAAKPTRGKAATTAKAATGKTGTKASSARKPASRTTKASAGKKS
jgi:small subunit ribosomal protein S16